MEKTRKERITAKKATQRLEQFKESNVVVKKGLAFVSTTLIVGSLSLPTFSAVASANELANSSQKKIEENNETPIEGTKEAIEPASTVDSSVADSSEAASSESESVDSSEVAPEAEEPAKEETVPVIETEEPLSKEEVKEQDISEVQAPVANYAVAEQMLMSRSMAPQAFINQIASSAQTIANSNDLYASVMIAQAILESGWGNSALASSPNFNLFGIKGNYNGQSVAMKTLEDDGHGNYYEIIDYFRKYPSYHQSLEDYASVLRNGPSWNHNYYSGAWKSNTSSYRDATAYLQGRYATDTSYASKLNSVIAANNLTQYDTGGGGNVTPDPNPGGETGNGNGGSTGTETTYTVKSGDSLWGIASKHGVSVANLKSWNNLKSDMIFVGQKLIVKGGTTTPTPKPDPTPTPDPTPNPGTSSTYTVKAGDSLWSIANKHGVSVANLKSWNNLKSDIILVGQKLTVKGGTTTPAPNPGTGTGSNNGNGGGTTTGSTYTVKSGDSLWAIANKHGVSVANLKAWNNLSSDTIHIGQTLTIKGGTTAPAPNPGTGTGSNNGNGGGTTTGSTYTVKSGDSLWSIANSNGVSVANLKAWNNLSSDTILVGQKLTIKGGTTTPALNPGTGSNNGNGGGTTTGSTYTVKSGDSLWAIANKNNVSVANLKSWNKLSSDVIFVGQKLVLKAGGSTTNTNTNTNPTSNKTYKVISGDSLWVIANKNGTTVANLKAWNNLKSDVILVGQTLIVNK
ncbi:MAG: LysM peptidoglycan-binding domain-containing protein [Carnobacterium sp.]|uniref:LysM peptidoglycan-binding domain-containing protein n=1 Tax=Carnobacterium sp. TaxID=48221 RepID=UPI00257B2EA2|nr:LysM peptidoglycan-binding domain-containing protein [Carnobacterium sp.]MBQ6484270.1 LysM peptidoglycan-binding domain-containing protein [Carnobacterium sp.]